MTVRRRVVAGTAAVLLLALAAWCLSRGVVLRTTTGGLLSEPVAQTRLLGPWLLAATVAFTAAVLAGLDAASGLGARWRARRTPPAARAS